MCKVHRITPNRFSAHGHERGRLEFSDSALSSGELGLWSSFTSAMKQSVETEWILLLEDDALLLPRFRRQVIAEIRNCHDDVMAIRMGWLGKWAWFPGWSFAVYVRRLCRNAVLLGPEFLHGRFRIHTNDSTSRLWGAHATLIRRSSSERLSILLEPGHEPLDGAILRLEEDGSGAVIRSKRNAAWQWPDRSDIRSL